MTPVTIRGVTYPSIAAASRAFGIERTTVSKAKRYGRLDQVGIGTGKYPRVQDRPGYGAKPIRLAGMNFPSRRALCRYLDKSDSYVHEMMRLGRYEQLIKVFKETVARKGPYINPHETGGKDG
jgi:hypothetical protein